MRWPRTYWTLLLFPVVLAGCGSGTSISGTTGGNQGVSSVSFNMQDTPPSGVSIVGFVIQVSGATLQPTDTTQPPVQLVTATDVDLEQFQSEPIFLGNKNVPAGTYNSITVSFANPRIAIVNNTNSPITVGGQTCQPAQSASPLPSVCKLTPALNQSSVTVSAPSSPFPITLAANSPLGLLLHFDVNSSVQNDLSITPTIDLKELTPSAGQIIPKTHVVGTVGNIDSTGKTFTLTVGQTGPSFLISTSNSTTYEYQGCPGRAPDFTCLANGQIVEVTAAVLSSGSLLALNVQLLENPQFQQPAFEGIVLKVDTVNNAFAMLLTGGQWPVATNSSIPISPAAVGVVLNVTLASESAFNINLDDVILPPALNISFASVSDMLVGQRVEIHAETPYLTNQTTVGPAITFQVLASGVLLDASQVTGTVAAPSNSSTFTLNHLPPLFVNSGITQMTIQTLASTQFFNDPNGVSGLNAGDTVSVGGLLFTPSNPTVVAETVLKRVICPAVTATGATTMIPCVLPPSN